MNVKEIYIPNGADLTNEGPFVRVCPDVILVVRVLSERLLADLAGPLRRARSAAGSNCRRLGSSDRRRRHYQLLLAGQQHRCGSGNLWSAALEGRRYRRFGCPTLGRQRGRLKMKRHMHVEILLAAEVATAFRAGERPRRGRWNRAFCSVSSAGVFGSWRSRLRCRIGSGDCCGLVFGRAVSVTSYHRAAAVFR